MSFAKDRLGARCVTSWALAVTITFAVGISGCGQSSGSKTYPVTVKVAFPDGTTMEHAIVVFRSVGDPDGGNAVKKYNATGKVQADGTCQLTTFEPGDGAVAGKHQVTVGPPPHGGRGDPDDPRTAPPVMLHPRFRSVATSGLEFTVTPEGPNEFSIQLESRR